MLSLRSMAVLSSRAQGRRIHEKFAREARENERRSREKIQSPRGFSALARLYHLVRPTKTAMLRRLHNAEITAQCPDYAHARASSVFSSKDNRTVILTRQDFLPDRTADRDLLFIFSGNILDFQRSLSSYIKIWLAVRRLIAILSLAGPPRDPKISFRSL